MNSRRSVNMATQTHSKASSPIPIVVVHPDFSYNFTASPDGRSWNEPHCGMASSSEHSNEALEVEVVLMRPLVSSPPAPAQRRQRPATQVSVCPPVIPRSHRNYYQRALDF
ncbi:hypothetical protein ACKKBG_A21400 [Auxenochlorella protothecoides x Auxenochlorella symbiontica]